MKIGFSLGQCVRDIVKGKVNIDHVSFVITGTLIKEKEQLEMVIFDYCDRENYLKGLDESVCQEIAAESWDSGRIIQPRMSGNHQAFRPFNTIWADIAPSFDNETEAVHNAWNHYVTVAAIAGGKKI